MVPPKTVTERVDRRYPDAGSAEDFLNRFHCHITKDPIIATSDWWVERVNKTLRLRDRQQPCVNDALAMRLASLRFGGYEGVSSVGLTDPLERH